MSVISHRFVIVFLAWQKELEVLHEFKWRIGMETLIAYDTSLDMR